MSTGEEEQAEITPEGGEEAVATKPKLDLDVQITDAGPCKKHLKVAIARAEVDRQFAESLGSVKKEAAVPGFRPGRAPKSLIQKKFRKEVAGQVKSTLLMATLEQLDEDYKLNAITQPNLDLEAIEIPEEGPMTFEMDVEVQPDFPTPAYKALSVKRPVREITDVDVEVQLKTFLERYAQIVPKFEGGAEIGDYITADLRFHKDGIALNQAKEIQFRLQPELRFQDGRVPDLAGVLVGARPGDSRDADALVGSASPDPALRGQKIGVTIVVHDLKTLRLPEVNREFLDRIGFETEDELRQALREVLERRVAFQQRQAIRRQIMDQLSSQAPFDLPTDLVARQERSNLRRQVEEMRQAGMTEVEIRAREAEVRANAHEFTLRNLKEFFLLSKIAEEEGIKVEEADVEAEIYSIALRTDETPRRVRARIEKDGLGEGLATQILERKTIDRILEFVKYEEETMPQEEEGAVETLDEMAVPALEEPAETAPAEAAEPSA